MMDTASLYNQEDNFQERASLGFSDLLARGRSQSRSHKSVADTIPTVFGSSEGGSFGRPEHDRISETRLFSHSRRPKKLASISASTTDDLMLREKGDRDWYSKFFRKDYEFQEPIQGGITP